MFFTFSIRFRRKYNTSDLREAKIDICTASNRLHVWAQQHCVEYNDDGEQILPFSLGKQ